MATENLITSDIKNAQFQKAYYNVCLDASALRVKLTSKSRVSKSTFNSFKRSFDLLFTLTWNRKELSYSQELVKSIQEWLSLAKLAPTKNDMQEGIELFSKYQVAMMEAKMIGD